MKYEAAIEKLNEIIEKLSSESVPLSEATKLFEEGGELVKLCHQELKEAKGKFYQIKKSLDNLSLEEEEK